MTRMKSFRLSSAQAKVLDNAHKQIQKMKPGKALSDKEAQKLFKHQKHGGHSKKHMAHMRAKMKGGASMAKAHKSAMKTKGK